MFATMLSKTFAAPRLLAAAALAAGVCGLPAAAQARHGFHIDVVVPVGPTDDYCPPPAPVVVAQPQQVWVEPVYRTVCDRQWVAPVVQTVTSHVWVAPVTQTVTRQVYVPDQYAWQTVTLRNHWGRPYQARQYVLVAAAHCEDRCDTCVVTPGHYEDVAQQQVVCEGHWATVEHQELVCGGHWETRVDAAPVYVGPRPRAELRMRLPF